MVMGVFGEPANVLDQFELPLEGLNPLTAEERLQRWLSRQDEWSRDVTVALLVLRDGNTRAARSDRWVELRHIEAPYDHVAWMVSGGMEVIWLHHEAGWAYVEGLYLACLLCAHAACERVLAGWLYAIRERLDKDWMRWGLGPLTKAAFAHGMIDAEMRDALVRVTESRKVSAHFKDWNEPNTVQARALARGPVDDAAYEATMDAVLREDACQALTIATQLVRGENDDALRLR